VVGGLLALARVAIDVCVLHTGGERVADEHEVDPHAAAAVEHARAVVPVGERLALERAGLHVGEACVEQSRQREALLGADVRGAGERGRIPDVRVGGGDVEVAAERERRAVRELLADGVVERLEPCELVGEVRALERAPVGHVDRPHAQPAAGGGDRPSLLSGESRLRGEAAADPLEARAGEDGDAVVAAVAVRRRCVPEGVQLGVWKGRVADLSLLQAQDVRLDAGEPLEHARQSRGQGVHVPGGESQRGALALGPGVRRLSRRG
jgi:hypothetical protein